MSCRASPLAGWLACWPPARKCLKVCSIVVVEAATSSRHHQTHPSKPRGVSSPRPPRAHAFTEHCRSRGGGLRDLRGEVETGGMRISTARHHSFSSLGFRVLSLLSQPPLPPSPHCHGSNAVSAGCEFSGARPTLSHIAPLSPSTEVVLLRRAERRCSILRYPLSIPPPHARLLRIARASSEWRSHVACRGM